MKRSPYIILGVADGKEIRLDLDTLMKTRMLIQANSGGGKSWLIRRLAEQLFGKIPVIIIDPEGEFATLREKFGFVLVGKGGETPADARSAALVAHKLLELRASAVCDLYELKPQERHHWVKLFLEGLINAPKNLWLPTVILIDEAHGFCPEGKSGQSEASGAVVDLVTRGRKRRFCAILATQRLGKLRKDASADLLNRLIGPTFEDVDLERAADLLSVAAHDKREFYAQMRVMKPGFFFGLGRAICLERTLLQVGDVQTSHEIEDTKFGLEAMPTPEAVKALLPKLADLPKAAEDKARTEADLLKRIAELNRELKAKNIPVTVHPPAAVKEVLVIKPEQIKDLELAASTMISFAQTVVNSASGILRAVAQVSLTKSRPNPGPLPQGLSRRLPVNPLPPSRVMPGREIRESKRAELKMLGDGAEVFNGKLPEGEEKILSACIQFPEGLERERLTVIAGYKRSTRDTYIARLRNKGLVTDNGGLIVATPEGIAALPDYEPLPVGSALLEHWRGRLSQGELLLLDALVSVYPEAMDRDALTEQTGFKRSTRDTYLARMRSKKVITEPGRSQVRASEELFD